MRFHLFKSKRGSTPKPNTIKKAEPVKDPAAEGDLTAKNDKHVLDITNVGAWAKENAVDDNVHSGSAVLKGKEPAHATLTSELDATRTLTNPQEAESGDCGVEAIQEVDEAKTTDDEPEQQQMIELLLGRQDSSSCYFTQRHITIPSTALPNSLSAEISPEEKSVTSLPDLCSHAFKLYQIWLHGGTISPRCQLQYGPEAEISHGQMWSICWPLFNAHILGCKIDAPNFADQVIDLLEDKLSGNNGPDTDTIKHLFTKGDEIPRTLKTFMVDKYIDARIGGLNEVDINTLPPAFLRLALQRAFVRLSGNAPTSPGSSCRYHTHAAPEACYRQSTQSQELRRQQRLDLDRKKSSSDAQELMRNFKENDIKTVDWEERRAKAIRATTAQPTFVESVLGVAQTRGAGDEIAELGPSQDVSASIVLTEKVAKPARLLHPNLIQDAQGHLTISSASAPSSSREGKLEREAGRSLFLPGAYPL